MILETVEQMQALTGQPVEAILTPLGLPWATYWRWQQRRAAGGLEDQRVLPDRRVPPPTPAEVRAVRQFACEHPLTGYKRLAWQMVDADVACLRPWQVYRILAQQELLCHHRNPPGEALRRPPDADRPDQRWHIDIMYLYVHPRWYYLVDILDAYSRYLVHWTLNWSMDDDTVHRTLQQALEGVPEEVARQIEIVHDHGSPFISGKWHTLVQAWGLKDIATRVAHPQSNGRLERLHRTHREEGLPDEALSDYQQALQAMSAWDHDYNHQRPHSALQYLCPVDYYRGNPPQRLAQRREKLAQALRDRRAYWQQQTVVKERGVSQQ